MRWYDTDESRALIERNMTNHPPTSPEVIATFEFLRQLAKAFAKGIDAQCPNSREKSLALTNVEQALMWAVAAVARNQEELTDGA